MTKPNILLIGDDCVDIYHYGVVERISPEAPVPIFKYLSEETRPGMAANVKTNLEALGAKVKYITGAASRKTRLIDHRSGQHIIRIDLDADNEPIAIDNLPELRFDAIVISDYDKGTVSYSLIEHLRREYAGPIFIDTKKTDLVRFEGCYVKINAKEYEAARSLPADLIVTLGDRGARYHDQMWPAADLQVVDVTGAGDTFLAAMVYNYLLNRDMYTAIPFAILASAVTVQHAGVYAPTLEEITCV